MLRNFLNNIDILSLAKFDKKNFKNLSVFSNTAINFEIFKISGATNQTETRNIYTALEVLSLSASILFVIQKL